MSLSRCFTVHRTNGSNNDVSTVDTVEDMKALVYLEVEHPLVLNVVKRMQWDSPAISPLQVISDVFQFVRKHVTYLEDDHHMAQLGIDPTDREFLQSAATLLDTSDAKGDCDDFAILAATLLVAAKRGIKVGFVIVKCLPEAPHIWSHVYVVAEAESKQVILDCAFGHRPNWEVPNRYDKRIYWIEGTDMYTNDVGMTQAPMTPVAPVTGLGFADTGYSEEIPWWQEVISSLAQTGANIAQTQWGTPMRPGVPAQGPYTTAPRPTQPVVNGISNNTLLIVAGVALAVFALKGK